MTSNHGNSTLAVSGWAATALAVAGLMLAGCGNGVLNNGGSTISAPLTMTPTVITDAPADQVLAMSLTVDSIVMTDATGAGTTVLSTPVTIEASHLDAVQEPLLPPLNVPQDTYVSATIKVANPVVVYVDTTTGAVVKANATLANASDTVTFAAPIMVTSTSSPILFDLLVGQSVTISGSTVTVDPKFNVTQIPVSPTPTGPTNGKVVGIYGQVVSVSGTNLTISLPNGKTLTLATNSATVLQGFASLSSLTAGEIVDVDVAQQKDGTLLALRIHLIAPNAANLFVGPVTSVTGSPATSFTELVRQPLGASAPPTATGSIYTVNITGSTTFSLAPQLGTLPVLPFIPTFSAATMFAGQNVATAAASVSGTTITAQSVMLVPQTVSGTVSAVTQIGAGITAYTVTLPAGSALATLTGKSSVVIYTSTSTTAANALPIAVGSPARFNGLLFSDVGTLKMVAALAADPPPTAPIQHP